MLLAQFENKAEANNVSSEREAKRSSKKMKTEARELTGPSKDIDMISSSFGILMEPKTDVLEENICRICESNEHLTEDCRKGRDCRCIKVDDKTENSLLTLTRTAASPSTVTSPSISQSTKPVGLADLVKEGMFCYKLFSSPITVWLILLKFVCAAYKITVVSPPTVATPSIFQSQTVVESAHSLKEGNIC